MKFAPRQALAVAGPSVAVVLFALPVLLTGERAGGYDWDWFFAHYEAVRRAIAVHHQFPWWNPWSAGGAPLFADPQVGVFSLQTPLVLAFGTPVGLKLGYLLHLLLGLWGMYLLLGPLGHWRRLLLAGVWIGSTFVQFHFQAGHYTFLQYLLVPLVFHAVRRGFEDRRWRIGAAIGLALLVNASPHNVTIQALLLLGVWLAHRLWKSADRRQFLLDQGWVAGLVTLLCLPRIVFALEYLRDFPRSTLEQPVGKASGIALAFLLPGQRMAEWRTGEVANWEQSAYLGLGTLVLVGVVLVRALRRRHEEASFLRLFLLAMVTLIIGVGPVVSFSPYALLSKLPVLDILQIPSRWFGWTLFLGVLALGGVRRWPRWGNWLLLAAVGELWAGTLLAPTPFQQPQALASPAPFNQYDGYPLAPGARSAMFTAMLAGYGELRAYEPMLGYDTRRLSFRCGLNKGCPLVTNGRLTRWSPNELDVQRLQPGPITLNMNPGRYWLMDGQRYPGNPRVAEPTWPFAVAGGATVHLQVRPARAWLLFVPLLAFPWLALLRFTGHRRRSRLPPPP